MKKLIVILIFISFFAQAQEAIFNIGNKNLYLLNYAAVHKPIVHFSANFDNSFEYYSKDNVQNTTNLNLIYDTDIGIGVGANIRYNYLNVNSAISEFDAIVRYKLYLSRRVKFVLSTNIGFLNNKISYKYLNPRYSFDEKTPMNLSFQEQNFNLGFSAIFDYNLNQIGLSVNHINSPNLPLDTDKIPTKYTAYIRNQFLRRRLHSLISYVYQDNYLLNPTDFDYYYDMLSYLGVNLEYKLLGFDVGLGYKYLSNFNDIYSAQVGVDLGSFYLNYSFSLMDASSSNKFANFHQIGIYYTAKSYRTMGVVMMPNF